MTLGLFPAVAFALALAPLRDTLLPAGARPRALAMALLWAAVAVPGALKAVQLLADTQAVQRDSLAFIRRNFAPGDAGFHPERALFCGFSASPLPLYFSQSIFRDFVGPQAEANLAHMEQRFRAEPIKFLVQSFRLNQFPIELRRFWAENYQPYRDSVFVAGRRLEGERGATSPFELIVPGRYRWLPLRRAARSRNRRDARRRGRDRRARARHAHGPLRRRCDRRHAGARARRAAGPGAARLLQGLLMRVALLTNILPAYRVPVFRALAATPGWQLRVFLSSGSEQPANHGLDVEVVKGLTFQRRIESRDARRRAAAGDDAPAVGAARRAAALSGPRS